MDNKGSNKGNLSIIFDTGQGKVGQLHLDIELTTEGSSNLQNSKLDRRVRFRKKKLRDFSLQKFAARAAKYLLILRDR